MKKMFILIALIILNISIFADDPSLYSREDIRNIIQNCINEAFELNDYIHYFYPGALYSNSFQLGFEHSERDVRLKSLNIVIYFNSGAYELNDYLNNIIENKIFIGLTNIFNNIDIYISIFYPFSIILQTRFYGHNYGLDELRSIIDIANDIGNNYNRVIIENINSINFINGYFMGNVFSTDIDHLNRINQRISNNFHDFLEILYNFFERKKIMVFR
jgi:hypothetical protein